MEGYGFSTEVSVRFAETDSQGIAHNSNYLVWFEVARIDYLARHAGGYQALRDQGLEAIVTEAHVNFRAPARFGDLLRIHARCVDVRGARFRYEYVVERNGTVIAEGSTSHAFVDGKTLRPTRVPGWLSVAIAKAEGSAHAGPAASASSTSSS